MWIALLVTGIVYLGYWLYQQWKQKQLKQQVKVILGLDTPPPAIYFLKDEAEENLADFHYKSTWLRIKSKDSIAVQSELDRILASIAHPSQPQTQNSEKWVFATVEDWVLVSSYDLPFPNYKNGTAQLKQLVQELSTIFGEAHYFGNHRTVDYYAWAKAVAGVVIRAYAYIGEQEDPLWEEGKLTPEEIELELDFRDRGRMVEWEDSEEENDSPRPDEQCVIMIAAAWRATSEN